MLDSANRDVSEQETMEDPFTETLLHMGTARTINLVVESQSFLHQAAGQGGARPRRITLHQKTSGEIQHNTGQRQEVNTRPQQWS